MTQGFKLLLFFSFGSFFSFSQTETDASKIFPDFKKYDFSAIYDSTYGITIYNDLVSAIGGDSIRYDHKGHDAQGWIEDYYKSGKILHKGYYVDGAIRVFKNFFENGELERSFRLSDGKKSAMTIYYPDGKVRSEVSYFGETVTSQVDYFENGQKEYEEESDKDGEVMWKRISYTSNGLIDNSLVVTDKKKKKFLSTENYSNGSKKVEGEMKLSGNLEYVKDGVWHYYDESGKITKTEKYHNGNLDEG